MAFRNFMKKPSHTPSFSVRPLDHLVDVGSPSVEPLLSFADNDQAESSSLLKDKGVFDLELAVIEEGNPGQSASVAREGSKRRRSITESLEEEATMVKVMSKKNKLEVPRWMSVRGSVPPPLVTVPKGVGKHPLVLAYFVRSLANSSDSLDPNMLFSLCLSILSSFHLVFLSYAVSFLDVEEAHATHNMISVLRCPLLKDEVSFLSFDELVDVFDVYALQMAVVGNMLTNESRILSQGHAKLKNYLVSLKSKKSLLEHEMSKLDDLLTRAQRNQDVEGSQVVKDLRSKNAQILKEKAITYGRSQALDDVHGLGDSWDFKDVQDYHPEAEKLFDEAAESFYKLKFPYISLLSEKAGQSLKELSVIKAPSIQETPST
ncbi:hypothetical protein Tco_0185761 [Tanacetum coccineum]